MSGNRILLYFAPRQVRDLFCSTTSSLTALLILMVDVTDAHVDAVLKSAPRTVQDGILNAAHAAVLSYTDAMTLDVQVSDDVFSGLKETFDEKEVVEITATIAAYNCVSRFLVALDVGERNAQVGPKEGGKD